jgi:hypothetical protein
VIWYYQITTWKKRRNWLVCKKGIVCIFGRNNIPTVVLSTLEGKCLFPTWQHRPIEFYVQLQAIYKEQVHQNVQNFWRKIIMDLNLSTYVDQDDIFCNFFANVYYSVWSKCRHEVLYTNCPPCPPILELLDGWEMIFMDPCSTKFQSTLHCCGSWDCKLAIFVL